MARKYLTLPCSTVDVERLFSDGGNIYSDERVNLKSPKIFKNNLFAAKNDMSILNTDEYENTFSSGSQTPFL